MISIMIEPYEHGFHDAQEPIGYTIPIEEGWALLPPTIATSAIENFPYADITTAKVPAANVRAMLAYIYEKAKYDTAKVLYDQAVEEMRAKGATQEEIDALPKPVPPEEPQPLSEIEDWIMHNCNGLEAFGDREEIDVVTSWTPLPMPEPEPPVDDRTPAEKRKEAYETLPIINWPENSTEKITVDQANQMYLDYFAEGNEEICGKLQDLIKLAKAEIREMYPDEE